MIAVIGIFKMNSVYIHRILFFFALVNGKQKGKEAMCVLFA